MSFEKIGKMTPETTSDVKKETGDSKLVSGAGLEERIDSDKRLPSEKGNQQESKTEYKYDGLSLVDKVVERVKGDFPKTVLDNVYNPQELKHYRELDLKPVKFGVNENGTSRFCLVPRNLDMNSPVDSQGRTNLQRAEQGKSLIKDGQVLEAHHIGQKEGGHYALLTKGEHRENGNYDKLHNPNKSGVDHGRNFEKDKLAIVKDVAADYKQGEDR